MTTDYAQVRDQLEEMLDRLVSRAERIDSDLSAQGSEDWEERAIEREDDEVLVGVGNVTVGEIEQVKQAIHRIDAGTYGQCARCGRKIPDARLKLLPFATTCTSCA